MQSSTAREEWALFGVTTLWGASFLLIRLAMAQCGPLCFVGVRFTCATLAMLLITWPILAGINKREIVGGSIIGLVSFIGFALQTWGLAEIESAKSGFLTAFYAPLVPVFELLLMRHKPTRYAWLGMAIAFPGVLLMTGSGALPSTLSRGEIVTLISAVVFALEIVLTGMLAPGTTPRRFVTVEVLVSAILAFITMPLFGEAWPKFSWFFIAIAAVLGLSTAFIQNIVVWAQKRIPPTRATVIYTAEPVWAGIFGFLAGEALTFRAFVAGAMIVGGILVSSYKSKD